MSSGRARIMAVVALGWAGLASGGDALASKCPQPNAARALAAADVVFVGRAVRQVEGGDSVFSVERVWKGQVPATVTLRFEGVKYAMLPPPERYLVYGHLPREHRPDALDVEVRVCGGSGLASALGRALKDLGPGRPPGARLVSGNAAARRRAACLAACRRRAMNTDCAGIDGDAGLMPCPCHCP